MTAAISPPNDTQQVVHRFRVTADRIEDFEFRVRFDKEEHGEITMDEPEPLGRDSAPNPARFLAAAVGDCLAASLLFCLQRSKIAVHDVHAEVDTEIVRNERGRLRIGAMRVRLAPRVAGDERARARCIEAFEDYCIVTQSVRAGIDVQVEVDI